MVLDRIPVTHSPWISVPLAALIGFVIAGLVLMMFRAVFRRTQGSSESRVATLVGMTATIITPIPENGVGEIAYVQSGSRYSAPARTENGSPIGNGTSVKITRVVGTQFYVAVV
jgi:membrane protein implicated in regulation of membrane protease activity